MLLSALQTCVGQCVDGQCVDGQCVDEQCVDGKCKETCAVRYQHAVVCVKLWPLRLNVLLIHHVVT